MRKKWLCFFLVLGLLIQCQLPVRAVKETGWIQNVVTAWSWVDPLDDYKENRVVINNEGPVAFSSVEFRLPLGISLTLEDGYDVVEPLFWHCPEYVQDEKGRWPYQGTYIFTAKFSDRYVLQEDLADPQITVILEPSHPKTDPVPVTVAINEAVFPDEAFRAVVSELDDHVRDGLLDEKELAVTEIHCSDRQIRSLKGIEVFKQLKVLEAAGNELVSADLGGLNSLETVDLSGQTVILSENNGSYSLPYPSDFLFTRVQGPMQGGTVLQGEAVFDENSEKITYSYNCDLKIAGEPVLMDVSLFKEVEGLPVTESFTGEKLKEYVLDYFDLDGNRILDEQELQQAESVILSDPSLRDITELSQLPSLTALQLNGAVNDEMVNALYTLSGLETIQLDGGSYTCFDAECFPLLQILKLAHNRSLQFLDVTDNPELRDLDVQSSGLKDLDVSQNRKLTDLNCSDLGLKELDLHSNPELAHLHCGNNRLPGLDLEYLEQLEELVCEQGHLAYLHLNPSMRAGTLSLKDNVYLIGDGQKLPEGFDFRRVDPSSITGGTIDEQGVVHFDPDSTGISYSYQTVLSQIMMMSAEDMTTVTFSLQLHTHDHWKVTYMWSEDNRTCTAIAECCEKDCPAVMIETVEVTSQVTKQPSKLSKGKTTYTAEFVSDWAETQKRTVADIPVLSGSDEVRTEISAGQSRPEPSELPSEEKNVKLEIVTSTMKDEKDQFHFRFEINDELNNLLEVRLDGQLLDPAHYIVNGEHIGIEFTSDFLDSMEAGSHELEILTVHGSVATEFSINRESVKKDDSASRFTEEDKSEHSDPVFFSVPGFGIVILLLAGGGAGLYLLLRRRKKSVID